MSNHGNGRQRHFVGQSRSRPVPHGACRHCGKRVHCRRALGSPAAAFPPPLGRHMTRVRAMPQTGKKESPFVGSPAQALLPIGFQSGNSSPAHSSKHRQDRSFCCRYARISARPVNDHPIARPFFSIPLVIGFPPVRRSFVSCTRVFPSMPLQQAKPAGH